MKITAAYTSDKRGIPLIKELVFDMALFELVNCKSIKSVLKTIRIKAESFGILKHEEVNDAEFSDQILIEEWKAYRKSVKGLSDVLNLVSGRWTLGEIHGIGHWKRVYENGLRLMSEVTDPAVLQYFAYLHDSCRADDGEDKYHGERAAEWIRSIRHTYLQELSDEQFVLLQEACRLHTTEERTGNPTIDACFDADRLDLWRVGIKPDPKKMATRKGAELAERITDKEMERLCRSISY